MRQGQDIFVFSKRRGSFWGPPTWGAGGSFQGRRVDHSLPSNAEVRNEWSYSSAPPTCMACTGTTLPLRFARGARIPETRSPGRLKFLRCSLILVGPQYGNCFKSQF